jgi:atypical dual specificity phosphatase
LEDEAFALRGARISGPTGSVLRLGDWIVPDRAITAVIGPAGTGKSTLLRALAGQPLPTGFVTHGAWHHRGEAILGPTRNVVWLPQIKHSSIGASSTGEDGRRVREALCQRAATFLLDEPSRCLSSNDLDGLVEALRAHARRGAAVVVSHDLAFVRRMADRVCMVCAGVIEACAEAPSFFASPPTDLARRFLEQGNCWPASSPPPLPQHFRWILPDQLAGMGRPGLLGEADEDLAAIAAAGVTLLVSLTEEPFPPARSRAYGMDARHFPIADMGVPAVGPCASLCRDVERIMRRGGRVVVHCHAGLGRTGTVLAAMLVWLGESPERAVERLRSLGRGYIQTGAQLAFVGRFAEAVGDRPRFA